jgi:alkylated DNA repair dioxygenase AlkB
MNKSIRVDAPPEGFRYAAGVISEAEERALMAAFAGLPLVEFEFHGYTGRRRVTSYGWHYEFETSRLVPADPIPAYLHPLREKAAAFAGLAAEDLPHALVTEYGPGAAIGWHRDKGVFADVIGVSFGAACPFRLRRKVAAGWERYSLTAEPRSIYLLRGPARTEWEHSIPGVEALRYSVTFRSLRGKARM